MHKCIWASLKNLEYRVIYDLHKFKPSSCFCVAVRLYKWLIAVFISDSELSYHIIPFSNINFLMTWYDFSFSPTYFNCN